MDEAPAWLATVSVDELTKRRKLKVATDLGELVLIWHDGRPHAMANICVHQDRELVRGSILGGRIVCPGHQWAFDLDTGFCRERERTQPVHETRIEDGIVYVRAT